MTGRPLDLSGTVCGSGGSQTELAAGLQIEHSNCPAYDGGATHNVTRSNTLQLYVLQTKHIFYKLMCQCRLEYGLSGVLKLTHLDFNSIKIIET